MAANVPKLTDMQIRAWVKNNVRFEGKSDGNGLYLCFREGYQSPVWRFRYQLAGIQRVMVIGSYDVVPLSKAREQARELKARVVLGHDVAAEKKTRKAEAKETADKERGALLVAHLVNEFYATQIKSRRKSPELIRRRLETNLIDTIGGLRVEDVKPHHIDAVIRRIVERDAPALANNVLQLMKRVFDYAVRRRMITGNPAAPFTTADAGGKQKGRARWLTRDEIIALFSVLPTSTTKDNELAIKLLLALCVRKMELCAARWDEFDLDSSVWYLPKERTKTGEDIAIPLTAPVIGWLNELHPLACGSDYLFPARKGRIDTHISDITLNAAMQKIRKALPAVPSFTIHDLRRTARTHLADLGVDPVIAERCLNHRIKGIEGIYNRHQYFDERQTALSQWADLLAALDLGDDYNVTPIRKMHKLS